MRMNAGASATYKQLEDGRWAVWTDREDCRPGKSITVTVSNGNTKLEKLDRQIGKSRDGKLFLWLIKDSGVTPPLFPREEMKDWELP